MPLHSKKLINLLCWLVPLAGLLVIWLSPLCFGPVPWPDDSAFYFVAKEFFKWPPRWVMLPQAPFEPSYAIWNFNTMPLYPLLLGIGRFFGIDGSHALKLWPLGAWIASIVLLSRSLHQQGAKSFLIFTVLLCALFDPVLRWASIIVRPESLIGLFGMGIVCGYSIGFPSRFQAKKLWHPVAVLLALGAYSHFNAVHLLFVVIPAILLAPEQGWKSRFRELFRVGALTLFYLLPWLYTVAARLSLFIQQMSVQWLRLSGRNDWLDTPEKAIKGMFQGMGLPFPWHPSVEWASNGLWILIFLAAGTWIVQAVANPKQKPKAWLIPSAGWVIGAFWLWDTKPEVWFTYYLHLAIWTFAGFFLLWLQKHSWGKWAPTALLPILFVFTYVNFDQWDKMSQGISWNWTAYHSFVDCVDQELMELEKSPERKNRYQPLQVWCPTFPDITIELSKRHPDWELTRTNDFYDRNSLALEHGHQVDAVVVTETINLQEREVHGSWSQHPEITSAWLGWKDYYLHHLLDDPRFKPHRTICQKGRWQAFILADH